MIVSFNRWANTDIGLLILRLFIGIIMAHHGWGKLTSTDMFHTFPDVIGIGHEASYILVVFAEFFCSLLLVAGLLTRYATIPLIITMLVIIFVVHVSDLWNKKELPVLFLAGYITLFFTGAGQYSVDHYLFRKK